MKQRVMGIGETVLDILFKNDQPQKAVPGGSTFKSIVSFLRILLGRTMLVWGCKVGLCKRGFTQNALGAKSLP